MDSPKLYQTLVDVGIFAEDEKVVLTEEFSQTISTKQSEVDTRLKQDLEFKSKDGNIDSYIQALDEFIDISTIPYIGILPIILSIHQPPPHTEGTPEKFLPLQGKFIKSVVANLQTAIVYIWQDNCDPCEEMRMKLTDVVSDVSDEIVLLSVYGPANAQRLYDDFAVKGAPTTLFVKCGTVSSRLLGSNATSTVRNELKIIRSTTSTRT